MTTRLRTGVTRARGEELRVDREAGIIRGYSLIERGEALTKGFWVDGTMLDQVAAAGAAKPGGVKSRFTHPGMSSDGLGTYLGRTVNVRREGDRVLGDLVIAQSAYDTPNGDLGNYVLDLAEEAPEMFGASIGFQMDEAAMEGEGMLSAGWQSDDELNVRNLPHGRLAALTASDFVDEPAANRRGLFGDALSMGETFRALADAALGEGRGTLRTVALGINEANARAWLHQYLEERGLMITTRNGQAALSAGAEDPEEEMSTPGEETATEVAAAGGEGPEDEEEAMSGEALNEDEDADDAGGDSDPEDGAEEAPAAGGETPADEDEAEAELSAGRRRVARLREALGAEVSAETLLSAVERGLSVEEALREEVTRLRSGEGARSVGFGGAPVSRTFRAAEAKPGSGGGGYLERARELREREGLSAEAAFRRVQAEHPELYAAYRARG